MGARAQGRVLVTATCRKLAPGHSHSVGVAARAVQPGAGRPFPVTEGVEPMGRGRAKAKQTRVARELKYSSPNTDLTALQRELAGQPSSFPARGGTSDDDDTPDDRWASEDDADDDWAASR
jgi:Protein of unknown function (DUF3073)